MLSSIKSKTTTKNSSSTTSNKKSLHTSSVQVNVSAPKITKKLGLYQIGEQIGKGAIGVVYKGINLETAAMVAFKQISLQNLREDEKKSIQMEINLLKKLKHENIVKYIDYISTENHLNIILEYVDSGSLSSIIKKFGPFPESLVAIYIKQVLTGLDYLHSQGVVHRDIKGANILTTKEGIVKLADFGVATKLNDGEKASSVVGTPYWMAPEIIEMRGHISTSCDIWSVGCTVIELLTGNPPYWDLAQFTALFRIVQDEHPLLPNGISENCKDFLLKCFHKEPVLRVDAKTLLKHPWVRSSNNEVYEIINSPNNILPEEVTNTIRMHIDKQGGMPSNLLVNNPSLINKEVIEARESSDGYENYHKNMQQDSVGNRDSGKNDGKNPKILHYEYLTGGDSPKISSSINKNQPNNISLSKQSIENDYPNKYGSQNSRLQGLNKSSSIRGSNKDFSNNFKTGDFTMPPFNSHSDGNVQPGLIYERRPNGLNSNFATLCEDGSFISVENQDGLTNTVYHQDSIPMNYRVQYAGNENALINSTNSMSKEEYKHIKELNDIMDKVSSIPSQNIPNDIEEFVKSIMRITEILKESPKVKGYFMKQYGLTGLLDLLENSHITILVHATLQLINQIIEGDAKLQEQSCYFGLLPYMIKFTQAEYAREVRVEAAYYLGQLAYSSSMTLQIFIASGGFKALVELLDLNYDENKDLICLAVDSLVLIFDMKVLSTQHLCKILFKMGIYQRLVMIIDDLYKDNDEAMSQYLFKALNLMINFAKCEDSNIRQLLCKDDILQVLQIYLKKFEEKAHVVCKVIKIVRFISSEHTSLNKLESIGILPSIIKLIQRYIEKPIPDFEDTMNDLLKILFHMSKLNPKRQEQIVLNGGIPILIFVCKNYNKNIKKIALPILCYFVQTSQISRKKLWEYGGPKIFLEYIDDDYHQPKILDTIALWMSFELTEIENILIDFQIFNKLIEVFKSANKTTFQQIVPIYSLMMERSEKFGAKLSKSSEFLVEVVDRLGIETFENENLGPSNSQIDLNKKGKNQPVIPHSKSNNYVTKKPVRIECSNPSPLVRKELLDILLLLCQRHPWPRNLLDKHNLYPIIMQILHVAQNEDMVILEEISTQLLQIYSHTANTPMRQDINY